jgi:four helix bundle protein
MYQSFEELEAWKECRKLRQAISSLTKKFPASEKHSLTNQLLVHHVLVVPIAEGHGRYHFQENIQFCRIARGSLSETQNHLTNALDEGYIDNDEYIALSLQVGICYRLINGYINYLDKQKKNK